MKVDSTISMVSGNQVNETSGGILNSYDPSYVEYDSYNNMIYVTGYLTGVVSVINASTMEVTGSMRAGSYPVSEALAPAPYNALYVANDGSYNISVMNTLTDKQITSISMGSSVRSVAYDQNTGYLYVVYGRFSIAQISVANNTVLNHRTISSFPVYPNGVFVDPYNNYVYITSESGNITVYNPATRMIVGNITTGTSTASFAIDSNSQSFFTLAGFAIAQVSFANDSIIRTITLNQTAFQITFDSSSNTIFAEFANQFFIQSIDASSGIATDLHTGYYTSAVISYIPEMNSLIFANSWTNSLETLNPSTGSTNHEILLGFYPDGSAYDPVNGRVYVTSNFNGDIAVVDPSNHTSKIIPGRGSPSTAAAYSTVNNRIYFVYGRYSIGYINTSATSSNLAYKYASTFPSYPAAIAYDTANKLLYIANSGSFNVSIFNPQTNTMVKSIGLGSQVTALAYDSNNGNMYVGYGRFSVAQIDSQNNSVINHVKFAQAVTYPTFLVYSPAENMLYVGGVYSNILSILEPSLTQSNITTLSFNTTSGLFAGTYDPETGTVLIASYSGELYDITGKDNISASVFLGTLPSSVTYDKMTNKAVVTTYVTGLALVVDVTGPAYHPGGSSILNFGIYTYAAIIAVAAVVVIAAIVLNSRRKRN